MQSTVAPQGGLSQLPSVLAVSVFSYLSYSYRSLARYNSLCRSFRFHLTEERVWQHLCKDFWYVTEERFEEWPSLSSYRSLYAVLEQWAALEGFYSMPSAYPWCLLVLVRFEAGALVAEAIRFRHGGQRSSEFSARLFEISFADDGPGSVRATVRFPADSEGRFAAGASVAPMPDVVFGQLEAAEWFRDREEVVPRWITARRGFSVEVGDDEKAPAGGDSATRAEDEAVEDEDDDSPMQAQHGRGAQQRWQPRVPVADGAELSTAQMVMDLLHAARSLPLALVRSPADYAPAADGAGPRIQPGLYAGDYGQDKYGQFSHEVLLIEYKDVCLDGVEALFARPFEGSGVPDHLAGAIAEFGFAEAEPMRFLVGSKVTGDVHVPAGQTTFVALCSPDPLRSLLDAARGAAPVEVVNRMSSRMERVRQAWPGWGTLAMYGFRMPSWSPGWLIQLESDDGSDRFGFSWARNQDIVVLDYVQAQQMSPFQNRRWLPEALR